MSDQVEKQCLVSHLDGYVRAIASIDGHYGNSIASVFVASINENDIQGSLSKVYQEFCQDESSFGEYEFSDVLELTSKDLQGELESQFLRKPFGLSNIAEIESLKKTRYEVVWKIIDLIEILADSSLKVAYKVEVFWIRSNHSYKGFMFIFPLNEGFLLIKILSENKS